MKPYVFTRGETIVLALDALVGDPLTVTAISAKLRVIPPGRTTISPSAPVAATFTVMSRAANGSVAAGWDLVAASTGLAAGRYGADARLEIAAGVIITDMVLIEIREGASG
jgi:hypothetical protein